MDASVLKATKSLVQKYSDQALQSFETRRKKIINLLNERSCPEDGWSEEEIELFLREISMMDSNNFLGSCGVGERESRFASRIVAQRHFYMGHGIGRSGDITALQPKAAGSTLIGQLANHMALDILKFLGAPSLKKCIIIPMATGMSILLCLRTLHAMRPTANYVLWPRMDQKSCFKCILAAGLKPVVVTNQKHNDGLCGSVSTIKETISNLKSDNIVCILSTFSSFAPKIPDDIVEIGNLCKEHDIPHLINNAYGIQCTTYLETIEQASKKRVDLIVSSTDKNFMVPVGGSLIYGFDSELVSKVGELYPGRGSATPSMDMFITLLNLGKKGYLNLLEERKLMFQHLRTELIKVAEEYGGRVLNTDTNELSLALELTFFESLQRKAFSEIGSMLFSKFVMGARVVAPGDHKSIDGNYFKNWGAHTDEIFIGYLTASAAIGIDKKDIDVFIRHLKYVLTKVSKQIPPKLSCEIYKVN